MVRKYIREASLLADNAAGGIGLSTVNSTRRLRGR
jgi:hypothetical protein